MEKITDLTLAFGAYVSKTNGSIGGIFRGQLFLEKTLPDLVSCGSDVLLYPSFKISENLQYILGQSGIVLVYINNELPSITRVEKIRPVIHFAERIG